MKVTIGLHHLMDISNALTASAIFCPKKEIADYNRYLADIVDKIISKRLKQSKDYWKRDMALKATKALKAEKKAKTKKAKGDK